ncbi:MAG: hypothetical protein IJK52_13595 [Oscillospiraceae bacterium]|nr:hypothetical protein [Oscillospiraceae bacterium]
MIYTNVLAICEERNIPIRKLEMECGIGNGRIRRWDNESPRVYAVKAVADYLGVTVDELLREPESREKAADKGDRRRKKAR